jgi:hypothetical protein
MNARRKSMDPDEAERRFAARLDEADLPRFASAVHDTELDLLQISWDHGVTLFMDLTREDTMGPIDAEERAVILGLAPCCEDCCPPIDVYVPGSAEDPRTDALIPGARIHRGPPLHPDDMAIHEGIPITSPSRTLIDIAECMDIGELRATFARAREIGLLDPEALLAARGRVEWRPSLAMLDEVIEEFCG